jgi:DNA-nicking Smr family endonuclease
MTKQRPIPPHKLLEDQSTIAVERFINSIPTTKTYKIKQLNRSEKRKFSSEATMDLHGCNTVTLAHTLESFCAKCITNGTKQVTIITGKGNGTIKQATLQWLLKNPNFIIGFFEIMDSICESGSFGVLLRSMHTLLTPNKSSPKK